MTDSPLDQARAAVADCRAALNRTADALHNLQPIASDPLTVAFIAIGASLAIRQLPDFAPDGYGQDGIVAEAIAHAALLDRLYVLNQDAFEGVYAYEVAEEFGEWFIRRWYADDLLPQVDACNAEALRLTLACCAAGTPFTGARP